MNLLSPWNEEIYGKTKVRFPSDNLTEAQLKKLNGPVRTYRFRPDVPLEELDTWPADLRKEYQNRFGR